MFLILCNLFIYGALYSLVPYFINANQEHGNIKGNPPDEKWIISSRNINNFLKSIFYIQLLWWTE